MKKNFILLIGITPLILITLFIKKLGSSTYFAAILTLTVIFTLFMSYLYFEKSDNGTKEIAIIATLSAFAAVARVPFAMIPNVQPTTFIVAISGLVFGPYEGFLVGSSAAFISNIFLGQGPWTPWQMVAWGVIGAISGLIGKGNKRPEAEVFAIICLFYGFLFGAIMNLWHIVGFIKDINKTTILLAYINSFPFDLLHGLGNFFFSIIFYEKFYKVLFRFKLRIT